MSAVRATIRRVLQATPTIKTFSLQVEPAVTFKAGQWLDVFIPDLEEVGGFSIFTCPPKANQASDRLDIAVKYSSHAPTKWMHEKCQEGAQIAVKVGGDVVLDAAEVTQPVLLVAGGIGVSPLFSMAQAMARYGSTPCRLLYSTRTSSELLFQTELNDLASTAPNFSWDAFLTREGEKRRIDTAALGAALAQLAQASGTRQEDVRAFVCGPPAMVDGTDAALKDRGVADVQFEKWW